MARPLSFNRSHWYAIKTMVGSEIQVANQLRANADALGDACTISKTNGIYDILPEKGHGKSTFRGFVYVKMNLTDASFKWILSTPKVMGFVSGKLLSEIQSIPAEEINRLKQNLEQQDNNQNQLAEQPQARNEGSQQDKVLIQSEAQIPSSQQEQQSSTLKQINQMSYTTHADHISENTEITEEGSFAKLSRLRVAPQEGELAMITGGALLYEVGEDVRVINEIYQQRGSSKIQSIHYPSHRVDKAQLKISFGSTPFTLSFKDIDKAFIVGTEVRYLKANQQIQGKIVQVHHVNEGDFLKTKVTIRHIEHYPREQYINQLYTIGKQINASHARIGKELLVAYDDFRELYLGVVTDKLPYGIEINGKAFDQSKGKPRFFEAYPFEQPQFFSLKPLSPEINEVEIKQTSIIGNEIQAASILPQDYLELTVTDFSREPSIVNHVRIDQLYQIDLHHAEGKQQLVNLINQRLQENGLDLQAEVKHYSLRFTTLQPNQHITISTSSLSLAHTLGLNQLFHQSIDKQSNQMILQNQRVQQKAQLTADAPLMEFDLQRFKNAYLELNGHKLTQLKYTKGKESDFIDQINHSKTGVTASLTEDKRLVLTSEIGNLRLGLSKDFALPYLLGLGNLFCQQILFSPPRRDKDEGLELVKAINQLKGQHHVIASLDERRLVFSEPISVYDPKFYGIRDLIRNLQSYANFYLFKTFEEDLSFKAQNAWVYDYLPQQAKLKDFQLLALSEINILDAHPMPTSHIKVAMQISYELDTKDTLKEIFYIGEALVHRNEASVANSLDRRSDLYVIYPDDRKRQRLVKFDQGIWVYSQQMLYPKNQRRDLEFFKKQAVLRPIKLDSLEASTFERYDRIPTDKLSHEYPKALVKKIANEKNEDIAFIQLLNEDGTEKANQEYWVLLSDLQKLSL